MCTQVLTGHSTKPLMKRCRICFNEAGGSDQCQGARNSCSGWSSARASSPKWTQPFRDDSRGGGGCLYQWRVECK